MNVDMGAGSLISLLNLLDTLRHHSPVSIDCPTQPQNTRQFAAHSLGKTQLTLAPGSWHRSATLQPKVW